MKKIIKRMLFNYFIADKVINKNIQYLGSNYGGFYLDISIGEKPIVLDVGIGEDMSFSETIMKIMPKAKIFAIDPTEKSFYWFKDSKFYSNKNVHFMRKALAVTSGTFNFYSPVNGEHVSHSLEINRNVKSKTDLSVEAVSLEDLCAMLKLDQIDILKVDIEGTEYAVLEGLSRSCHLPKQICVEYHDRFYNLWAPRSRKTHRHLKSMGYELIGISTTFQEITYKLK